MRRNLPRACPVPARQQQQHQGLWRSTARPTTSPQDRASSPQPSHPPSRPKATVNGPPPSYRQPRRRFRVSLLAPPHTAPPITSPRWYPPHRGIGCEVHCPRPLLSPPGAPPPEPCSWAIPGLSPHATERRASPPRSPPIPRRLRIGPLPGFSPPPAGPDWRRVARGAGIGQRTLW